MNVICGTVVGAHKSVFKDGTEMYRLFIKSANECSEFGCFYESMWSRTSRNFGDSVSFVRLDGKVKEVHL